MIDRERELIRNYDDAHRAYLEALEVVRARVFGRTETAARGAKSQVTKAKRRLDAAQQELQEFWSKEAIAQEVSR